MHTVHGSKAPPTNCLVQWWCPTANMFGADHLSSQVATAAGLLWWTVCSDDTIDNTLTDLLFSKWGTRWQVHAHCATVRQVQNILCHDFHCRLYDDTFLSWILATRPLQESAAPVLRRPPFALCDSISQMACASWPYFSASAPIFATQRQCIEAVRRTRSSLEKKSWSAVDAQCARCTQYV